MLLRSDSCSNDNDSESAEFQDIFILKLNNYINKLDFLNPS